LLPKIGRYIMANFSFWSHIELHPTQQPSPQVSEHEVAG
jgi:hypothetical protein